MTEPNATFCLLVPDLTTLSDEEKDALIVKLWSETVALRLEVEHLRNLNTALERRLSELENKLNQPPKLIFRTRGSRIGDIFRVPSRSAHPALGYSVKMVGFRPRAFSQ